MTEEGILLIQQMLNGRSAVLGFVNPNPAGPMTNVAGPAGPASSKGGGAKAPQPKVEKVKVYDRAIMKDISFVKEFKALTSEARKDERGRELSRLVSIATGVVSRFSKDFSEEFIIKLCEMCSEAPLFLSGINATRKDETFIKDLMALKGEDLGDDAKCKEFLDARPVVTLCGADGDGKKEVELLRRLRQLISTDLSDQERGRKRARDE
jgi:hypothetical protein